MILPVHSDFVSGLYFVIFEICMPLILGLALRKIIYTYNLHKVHNRTSGIRLTSTRLSIVAGYGITSKTAARFTSILGCISLIFTVIGALSINGASRTATKFVSKQLLVTVANTSSSAIEFTKHVSSDGSRVSATFLMAKEAVACIRENATHVISYGTVGGFEDVESIDKVIHSPLSRVLNLSCTAEEDAFVAAETLVERRGDVFAMDKRCKLFGSLPDRNFSLWKEKMRISCRDSDIEVMEMWCASYVFYSCVMHLRQDEEHAFLYISGKRGRTSVRPNLVGVWRSQAIPSQVVKSAAYLMGKGLGDNSMIHVAQRSIQRNVPVEVKDGEVFETQVRVVLLLCTVGVVTVSTSLACVVALLTFWQPVGNHRLTEINGFNGALDIMKLAAQVIMDGERVAATDGVVMVSIGNEPQVVMDGENVAATGGVVMVISGREPRVRPVLEGSGIGGATFGEEEVDGKLGYTENDIEVRKVQTTGDDGGSDEGGSDEGGSDEGGSDDGGSNDGSDNDGSGSDGGANDGGGNDGGGNDGGGNDGGGNDGRGNDGSSNDGGGNDGGGNDGGGNDGGGNDGGGNDGGGNDVSGHGAVVR